MESEIEAVLKEEKEEKQLATAEMQVTKGENLIRHQDEILARPKRTWFESEEEKKKAKRAGREELNGVVVKSGGKTKLSGKDKKRLDDHKERVEGRMWKKGKGDARVVDGRAKRGGRSSRSSGRGRGGGRGNKRGGGPRR